jgi:hypothetical protein
VTAELVFTRISESEGNVGRQVRFFNFPADVAGLETFAVEGNQSTIIRATAPTAEPAVVPTLRLDPGDPSLLDLLLVRPSDLPRLRWRHVSARDLWTVDKNCSPVVEYMPGYTRNGQPAFLSSSLAHGRMWFQTSHWEGDQLVDAVPEFVAWAGRLFRWIKKQWILIDGNYFSPEAAKLWTAIWQVVLDEPCEGTGGDQISRWRQEKDPDNLLPNDAVHIAISKATRHQPRRLTIAVRRPANS